MQNGSLNDLLTELKSLNTLPPHVNVVRCFGYCERPFCIVMEYVENGNLYDFLKTKGSKYETLTYSIILGIAQGMKHIVNCQEMNLTS